MIKFSLNVVLLFLVFLSTTSSTQSAYVPTKYASVNSIQDSILYLVRFGYLKDLSEVGSLLDPSTAVRELLTPGNPARSAFRIALTKFQQYAKLPQTGEFDDATKAKMNSVRCGNKDILPNLLTTARRKKRFAVSGLKWQKRDITYHIKGFSETGFPSSTTEREIETAFQLWSNNTNLNFIRTTSPNDVDIEMYFARLDHGDIDPFDGRGIVLAHAFPPGQEIGGDVHFDDDENWTSQTPSGTNFLHVAVHEIGHALGLRHSEEEDAIMFAFARSWTPNLQLHPDDIKGIQELYGTTGEPVDDKTTKKPTIKPPVSNATTAKPPVGDSEDICKNTKFDAITTISGKRIYAFSGSKCFLLDENGAGIISTYPISQIFIGLDVEFIDAAFTTKQGKTYFFKDDKYWRFEGRKMDGNYPKNIADDFSGVPNNIDAAFVWSGDGETYFFKDDQYWGFDWSLGYTPVNFPLPISQWFGLPEDGIDGAFQSPKGLSYFFKDDKYWLFDDENFEVLESDPPYPRETRVMWLGCTPFRPDEKDLTGGQSIFKRIARIIFSPFVVIKRCFF